VLRRLLSRFSRSVSPETPSTAMVNGVVASDKDTDLNGEARSLENPDTPLDWANLQQAFGTYSDGISPISINPRTALGYAPLYQVTSMISGDCAKLPLNVYRKSATGRTVESKHPAHRVIDMCAMPNPEVNGFKFWRRFYTSACLWGNAYAWIDRNNRGEVIGLYQLMPDRTYMERQAGVLYCRYQTPGGTRSFDPADVLHVEGLSIDGLQGANIITTFRKDFMVALSAKNFLVQFFRNNMTAGGILQVKPGTKPEAIRKMEKRIEDNFQGSDKAFKTLVLKDNFVWHSTQVDPQKAQLSEIKEDSARDVARMYNVAPSRLGLKDSVSFNSEEMAKQNYHDGALSHMLLATSCECTTKLLTPAERNAGMYIEHNVNALLWADALTRSVIANSGIQAGRFSPNETRAWENADGYTGGDTYYVPLNVQPVGQTRSDKRTKNLNSRSPRPSTHGRGAGGEGLNDAYRALATQAFTRAINRASIRLKRKKDLQTDKAGIIEIVDSTMRNIGLLTRTDCSKVAEEWFSSIVGLDATSLRAQAESSYLKILDRLLTQSDSPSEPEA
jgi:HK97 family phage portal protein